MSNNLPIDCACLSWRAFLSAGFAFISFWPALKAQQTPDWMFVLVDDTDRAEEQQLVIELCQHLGCQATRIETEQFKANGDVRKFDILERR